MSRVHSICFKCGAARLVRSLSSEHEPECTSGGGHNWSQTDRRNLFEAHIASRVSGAAVGRAGDGRTAVTLELELSETVFELADYYELRAAGPIKVLREDTVRIRFEVRR